MTEKIIFDGKEFCNKYLMCENGCPLWNDTCYCPIANGGSSEVEITIIKKETEKPKEKTESDNEQYPQDQEKDECRYLIPHWLLAMSEGLTRGAVKHPGETWRQIPAKEHAWRAIRHILKYIADDTEDDHLTNASMRVMMAWETARGLIDDKDNV